ncbi:hypothetical protein AN640_05005 [Candidatus Epulonipiscium fishelsonii]|uniref:Uncharacterized protein n=1 Tax=Candidatus Epulonipiscium fishelsonii TaxID=77094 RepID=A0ACC8XI31_9FIRM|nr:hypothetical protein AN640_05005 [Epulopiscium sp. SCG-D08WGA-EpuloA1]
MNTNYKELLRKYDLRQTENRRNLEERKRIIYKEIPEVEILDNQLSTIGIRLLKSMLNEPHNNNKEKFENYSNEKIVKKNELLKRHNYTPDYLELKYSATRCNVKSVA